uniref:Si:ch1073-390k14.1 n=1 Tax=Neogobius melanostomus TaxID=47308 RepID=A0A8C6SNQ7_9GOBI
MSPSTGSGENGVSVVRKMLREVLVGHEDPEGFFAMCVSVLGHHDTWSQFLTIIRPLSTAHVALHCRLTAIYDEYFTHIEDDELHVAMTLSLLESEKAIKSPPNSCKDSSSHSQRPALKPENISAGPNQPLQKGNDKGSGQSSPSPKNDDTHPDSAVDQEKAKCSRKRRQKCKVAGQQVVGLPVSPSSQPPVLLWFRRDLRLCDNPAIIGALEVGAPVLPVFIWAPDEEEGPGTTVAVGGACKFWLHQALPCLRTSLERIGSSLVFLRAGSPSGSSLQTLRQLLQETGARTVVANALYEPWLKERDDEILSALSKDGVDVRVHHSYCLRDPFSVSTVGVGLRGIGSVSHFMSCCKQNPGAPLGTPLDPPLELAKMPRRKDGSIIDWAANIRKSWDFSEEGAHAQLEGFLQDGVYRYEKESGRADSPNTSGLSPYLHFGQLSPRWLLWDAKGAKCRPPKFQRKLAWRDLAYWQLTLFPDLPWESLRPPYKALRWSSDRSHLKAWQRGRTGFPLVDAAMRQLWLSGWMNNYMRHVVASFLIAYLHLPWQEGYCWFQDTLVDADVAIDAMMWQNGGMCGLDHWNFVMHPVDAALTCDPCGTFVRQWCPELAELPDELIHKPWKCPASMLRRAGVVLGETYPKRIITDLEERRTQSLKDVAQVRQQFGQYVDKSSGCDLVPMPPRLVSEALGLSNGDAVSRGKWFLLPLITRMEFKHQLEEPDSEAASNPYNAVLKGYVSRKRDETIRAERGAQRRERMDTNYRRMEGLTQPRQPKGRARRTPTAKDKFSVVPGGVVNSLR